MIKNQGRKTKSKKDSEILLKSRRRCCICFGLNRDTREKRGQIAHLDGNRSNNSIHNLAFLCLDHHDVYDSRTSQSKSLQISEVKTYREELYHYIEGLMHGPLKSGSLDSPDVVPREIEEIFFDDFRSFEGWQQYIDGRVSLSSDHAHTGKHSLKKEKHNDPNGGYKLFGVTIDRGFIFSGWVFRPSVEYGGRGDLLAVENVAYDGYGFGIAHGLQSATIHKRVRGRYRLLCDRYRFKTIEDNWYHFDLHVDEGSRIELCIDDSIGNRLLSIIAVDPEFRKFDRVVIHGGCPYYVDDIKVIKV